MLIRCMENEAASSENPHFTAFHYQAMLSELWIGQCYEICRLLIETKTAPHSEEFNQLAHNLRLLRIGIEKHQIAQDSKLQEPMPFKKNTS